MDHWFADNIYYQSQSEKHVTMASNESTGACTIAKYKHLSHTLPQQTLTHLGSYVVHERPTWQRHWAGPQQAGRGLGEVHHDVCDGVVGVTDVVHHLRHSVHLHLSRSHLIRLLAAQRGSEHNA